MLADATMPPCPNAWYQSTGVGTGDQRAASLANYVTQLRSLKYSRGRR
jgi:hypothetical protein